MVRLALAALAVLVIGVWWVTTSFLRPGAVPMATPNPTPSPATPLPVPAPPATPAPTPQALTLRLPSIPDLVDAARPAVVAIFTEFRELNVFLQPVPRQGAGSGFIFRPDGYILTNSHVVEGAESITVVLPKSPAFPRGAEYEGKVIGRDPFTDLAVVKIEAANLPTLTMGDFKQLRVGDWVVAIGNAQSLPGGPTVTLGIVSAVGRSIDIPEKGITLHDLVQTDAAINPGNSGGPLLNVAGQVVGINTAIVRGAENIGFAISAATARSVIEELVERGGVDWPWLGVSITTLTPVLARERGLSVEEGVLVIEVMPGYPAEQAGFKPGDVIIRFAGVDTPDYETFRRVLRQHRAGDTVEIVVKRGEDSLTLTPTLAEIPARF